MEKGFGIYTNSFSFSLFFQIYFHKIILVVCFVSVTHTLCLLFTTLFHLTVTL